MKRRRYNYNVDVEMMQITNIYNWNTKQTKPNKPACISKVREVLDYRIQVKMKVSVLDSHLPILHVAYQCLINSAVYL